jgi:hypothetical protein
MGCGDWELLAVLEGAVLDQFGVDTTITGVVDVLNNVSNAYRYTEKFGPYFMEEAIAIRMTKTASHVSSRRLDNDVNSNDRSNESSDGESLPEENHIDDGHSCCSELQKIFRTPAFPGFKSNCPLLPRNPGA